MLPSLPLLLLLLLPLLLSQAWADGNSPSCSKPLRVAVFVQYNLLTKKVFMLPCLESIAEARNVMTTPYPTPMEADASARPHCVYQREDFNLDVYMFFGSGMSIKQQEKVISQLGQITGISNAFSFSKESPDFAASRHPYFFMLNQTVTWGKRYDISLKLRYDKPTDRKMLKHSMECMCGTPSHVVSVLQGFVDDPIVSVVGPHGLVYGQKSIERDIATLHNFPKPLEVFTQHRMDNIKTVRQAVGIMGPADGVIVYGGTYWSRFDVIRFDELRPQLLPLMKPIRQKEMEWYIDILFPTIALAAGGQVRTMMPAPKIMPLYFPQYHSIPENDKYVTFLLLCYYQIFVYRVSLNSIC
jgi:hypothetical protein